MNKKNDSGGSVLLPKKDVFESKHVIGGAILGAGQRFNIFERVEYPKEGGMYIYYKQLPFPKKGFPYPEAIWMNDVLKKNIMLIVDVIGRKEMLLAIFGFVITPWKIKVNVLEVAITRFASIADWLMRGHYLKEEYYSPAATEIRVFVRVFMKGLGFTGEGAKAMAKIASTIIEYDDAYRLRIEDIMCEANVWNLWKSPSKELSKLFGILEDRELSHAKHSFRKFSLILRAFLWLPKARKAFRNALRAIDIGKLRLDDADRYHVLLRDDYKFFGKTFQERCEIYKKDYHPDGKFPPTVEITG